MKRLVSVAVVLAMLLCCCNVSASVSILYDAMTTPYFSATADTEFSVKLNRPLTFLNQLDEEQRNYIKPVDIKQLAESAMNMTETATSSAVVDPSYRKIELAMESELNLPLEFNDNLKADIWALVGVWYEMDLNDINKPIFNMVFKLPFSDKYIVMDYSDMVKSGADISTVLNAIENYSSGNFINELSNYMLSLIKANCTIKEYRTAREYVITADDAGFKAIVDGIVQKYFEIAEQNMGEAAKDVFTQEFYDEMNSLGDKLNNIPILGDEGFKMKVTVNNKKQLVSVDTDIDICVNIYDIMSAFEEDVVQYNRDDWYVDLLLSTRTAYSKLNEDIHIAFPQMDDTNSISITDSYGYGFYNEDDISVYTSYPLQPDSAGDFMLPLRDCLASAGVGASEYTITDGVVAITPQREDGGIAKATLEVGSNKMLVNGSEKTLSRRVEKTDDGVVTVPADMVEFLTNSEMTSARFAASDGGVSEITYVKSDSETDADFDSLIDYEEMYQPEDGEVEEDYVYVSPSLYLTGQGVPYVVDGMLYIPVEDTMYEFGVSDISNAGGVMTITADSSLVKEFGTVVFTENSKTVTVDSQQHTMSNAVVSKDGVMYMPIEFFDLIDCRVYNVCYYFSDNDYHVIVHRNQYRDYEYDNFNYMSYSEYKHLFVEYNGELVKDESGYYLPLRNIMGQLLVRDENIVVEGENAVITADNPATGFGKITIDGTTVDVDGVQYTLDNCMRNIDGITYVPQQFVTDALSAKIQNISVEYGEEMRVEYTIEIKNPLYVDEG
ncbi:MAG: hypothetical protein IJ365_00655 [Clostridia bacterium]|nr:hypothetical protein [Clostridia bacterium]